MSTRKPSQPFSSQKRITSQMASRVSRVWALPACCCQGALGVPKPKFRAGWHLKKLRM